MNSIARDSRGRTHGENRSVMPESSQGDPPLVEVSIFDPETHLRTHYEVRTKVANQSVSRDPHGGPDASNSPALKVEDLGVKDIEGLDARGTRRTFTISAAASGTGAPLEVVDEYWYSEDLHLNLLVSHRDPRLGVRTFTVTHLNREEPPESLFEVPVGYTMLDSTSSASLAK
jgi:hypothetical protein